MAELMAGTCEELKARLSDYIDGELDADLCEELEQHLAGCGDCRIVVDTLRKTIVLYRDYGTAPMPRDAHARLVRALKLQA